jgi:hypothetical protein
LRKEFVGELGDVCFGWMRLSSGWKNIAGLVRETVIEMAFGDFGEKQYKKLSIAFSSV